MSFPAFSPSSAARLFRSPGVWLGFLILVAGLVYFPALHGAYLWDDLGHVTKPALRSWEGLQRIWFQIGATQQYYPLLHTAFWIEHRLWGDATTGYHAVTILFHAVAAGLFGMILSRLAVPGAKLAALLFLLHPVCVESVAWIAEQKNTLSAVFYLGSALVYLRFAETRHRSSYAWAFALFALALLTKSVTATLPAALLLLLWLQRGRLSWRLDVCPLVPWFVLGIAAGLQTAWFEQALIGAQGADFDLSPVQRGLLAGRVVWFYLGKLVWPAELIFIYPRWTIDATQAWAYVFPVALVALLIALWRYRHHHRGPLVAVLYYVGTLFPVLGFVNVYPFIFSYVADHFQYLASLGIFALTGAGLTTALTRVAPWIGRAILAIILLALGGLTARQSALYRDQVTLYQATIQKNPSCWMAHNNLGEIQLNIRQNVPEAIRHFEAALRLKPDHANARNNLGTALAMLPGRWPEAIAEYEQALRLRPDFPEAHYGLANVLLKRPDSLPAAMAHYEAALRSKPDYAEAHGNLGVLLTTIPGRLGEAIAHFEQAVRIKPDYVDAHSNLALVLANVPGRQADAIVHYQTALRLKPDLLEARFNLGLLLSNDPTRHAEAIAQFELLLKIKPDWAQARQRLEQMKSANPPR